MCTNSRTMILYRFIRSYLANRGVGGIAWTGRDWSPFERSWEDVCTVDDRRGSTDHRTDVVRATFPVRGASISVRRRKSMRRAIRCRRRRRARICDRLGNCAVNATRNGQSASAVLPQTSVLSPTLTRAILTTYVRLGQTRNTRTEQMRAPGIAAISLPPPRHAHGAALGCPHFFVRTPATYAAKTLLRASKIGLKWTETDSFRSCQIQILIF